MRSKPQFFASTPWCGVRTTSRPGSRGCDVKEVNSATGRALNRCDRGRSAVRWYNNSPTTSKERCAGIDSASRTPNNPAPRRRSLTHAAVARNAIGFRLREEGRSDAVERHQAS